MFSSPSGAGVLKLLSWANPTWKSSKRVFLTRALWGGLIISSHLGHFHGSFSRGWKPAIKSPKPRAGRKPGGLLGCSPCCELRSRELRSCAMENGGFLPAPRCSREMLNKHHEHWLWASWDHLSLSFAPLPLSYVLSSPSAQQCHRHGASSAWCRPGSWTFFTVKKRERKGKGANILMDVTKLTQTSGV